MTGLPTLLALAARILAATRPEAPAVVALLAESSRLVVAHELSMLIAAVVVGVALGSGRR
ncbi:MAG: hypothetical protein ABTQ29_13360 [Siculibacillus sp.]